MKSGKNIKLLIILISVLLLIFVLSGYVVHADVGFDTDFDLGGGGGELIIFTIFYYLFYLIIQVLTFKAGFTEFIVMVCLLTIIAASIVAAVKTYSKNNSEKEEDGKILHDGVKIKDDIVPVFISKKKPEVKRRTYTIWYIDEVKKVIPNINKKEFFDMASDMYVKLQEAWMNFDYKTMRKLTTDDLYNSYKTMLESLERKKQKNIVSDIKVYGCNFTNAKNENGKYTVEVELDLAYRDYIVQEKNNDYELVRGVVNRLDVVCLITLVSTERKETSTCPVCGGPISKNNQSDKCKFCGNTIVKENYNWLISKKEIVSQKIIKE